MSNNEESSSENASKRPRLKVTNPYLKPKPATRQPPIESSTTNGDTTSSNIDAPPSVASLPVANDEKITDDANLKNEATSLTFGDKESAVDRLPSRNVSFESAEILTLTEVQKHASLYLDRSVRITGVVRHRLVSEDGNVCFVLSDPNAPLTKPRKPSILKTPGITPRFVNRKRPLSSLKKPPRTIDPLDSAVNTLLEQQPSSVLVYAVSTQVPSVNDCAVGDLIMALGEVRLASHIVATVAEKWNETKSTAALHVVHARILRNVNGTDMRLHDEALRMRRQHLLQQATCGPDNNVLLLPGCGPPPYYDNNEKEASV